MRRLAAALGIVLLQTSGAAQQASLTAEIDWRSRAKVGSELLYEWELEAQSNHTGIRDSGMLLDRVYAQEGADFLGVRLVTRTSSIRSELRFFRLHASGEVVDDAPLEAFAWDRLQDDFPFHDPIGRRNELVVGLVREREVTILDPLLRAELAAPVPVREEVTLAAPDWMREEHPDPDELAAALAARRDEPGLWARLMRVHAPADDAEVVGGEVALLALRDTSTFELASGVIRERELEFTCRHGDGPMVYTQRRRIREVRAWPSIEHPDLASSGLALREAWRIARTDPREAERLLRAWARDGRFGFAPLEDVAGQVWLLTARAEREHSAAVASARRLGPPADADLAVAGEESFEALRRGRLTALFTHLALDGASHRAAYAAALARRGLDPRVIALLMRVHDQPAVPRGPVPEPQRSEGPALLDRSLRELAEAR